MPIPTRGVLDGGFMVFGEGLVFDECLGEGGSG
jgi:hypothetical protein